MEQSGARLANFLAIAGIGFATISLGCVLAVIVMVITPYASTANIEIAGAVLNSKELTAQSTFLAYIILYIPHLILILLSVISALIGKGLLNSARRSGYSVLPPGDFNLIKQAIEEGKEEPVNQYIRVASLSGFTGAFTKVGLTGLPLTTVALTVLFTALSLSFYTQNEKVFTSLLDLAKLTLGAFIGSYVQRQVERSRQEAPGGASTPPRPSLPA